jgi:predicted Rossmann fold flavoprotein
VQVKTVTSDIKTLKGIRVSPAKVTAEYVENGKTTKKTLTGDLLFTDYGVSGDLIFRLSAFFSDNIEKGVRLFIDFLPEFSLDELTEVVKEKRRRYPETPFGELLCGIVNNQVGRAVTKKVKTENLQDAVALLKNFPLTVTGTLGFDYAQVTKGGIKIEEVDENLQSKKANGLYFTGEILDVDGECGGFNLQWAYSSAMAVATALNEKTRGQV